jgi:hypothetical protein
MPDTDVTISLTSDEALILFDVLHRWEDEERVSAPSHRAEQVALWNFVGALGTGIAGALQSPLCRPGDGREGSARTERMTVRSSA